MDAVIFLLFILSLTHHVVPQAPTVTSFRASVEIVSKTSRIFSGESLDLRCSVPGFYMSSYTSYLWFRGSERLPHTGETMRLWNLNAKDAGKFSCQGTRDSVLGTIKTQPSLPVEVHVDGGWAILQTPPHPFLVGETMTLLCRLRVKPPVHETILYKDGIEAMRQNGSSLYFYLTNATVGDNGMYSCRASWDVRGQTVSVSSADTPVQVVEVLSKPVLEIDAENAQLEKDQINLICHVQYHAPAPAPPINYYFYRNNKRLGLSTSENHDMVRRTPGWYSCRAKVPQLGLSKCSEAKGFGDVTGIPMPPGPCDRSHMPMAPADSLPEDFLTSSVHEHTKEFDPSFIEDISLLSKDQLSNPTQLPRH